MSTVHVNSRDSSTSPRGVSNSKREERRGEPEREGRKGEFVNTLLPLKFSIEISTALNYDKVARAGAVFIVCYCQNDASV